jgi:GT2 family glycosyltransferase
VVVSVVVVCFNAAEFLPRCLQALAVQRYRAFELILVDNASRDDTVELITRLAPHAKVLALPENLGFAAANNLAIESARGDWIACLNPDAFPDPGWLESLVQATEAYPDYAFFGSMQIDARDAGRLDGTGDAYHVSGYAWRRDFGVPVDKGTVESDEIFSPCAAAAFYQAKILREVGGFDGSYFCYFEDVDLGFRLRLRGYRCRYVPDAKVFHLGSATTGYRSDFSLYHGHRNLVWTYLKNVPMPLLLIYLPQHILATLVIVLRYAFSGKGAILWQAKRDAFKGFSQKLSQRKAIQSGRRVSSWELRRIMTKGFVSLYARKL